MQCNFVKTPFLLENDSSTRLTTQKSRWYFIYHHTLGGIILLLEVVSMVGIFTLSGIFTVLINILFLAITRYIFKNVMLKRIGQRQSEFQVVLCMRNLKPNICSHLKLTCKPQLFQAHLLCYQSPYLSTKNPPV